MCVLERLLLARDKDRTFFVDIRVQNGRSMTTKRKLPGGLSCDAILKITAASLPELPGTPGGTKRALLRIISSDIR